MLWSGVCELVMVMIVFIVTCCSDSV